MQLCFLRIWNKKSVSRLCCSTESLSQIKMQKIDLLSLQINYSVVWHYHPENQPEIVTFSIRRFT